MSWHEISARPTPHPEFGGPAPWLTYSHSEKWSGGTATCWLASIIPLNIPFAEGIYRAGPSTPRLTEAQREVARVKGEILCEPLIWQAESLYRQVRLGVGSHHHILLVNFGKGSKITGPTACEWAEKSGRKRATPWDVFSLCIGMPRMYKKLGNDPVGFISTDERLFDGVYRTPCVWQGSTQKECAFVPFNYPLHDSYWFAFRVS